MQVVSQGEQRDTLMHQDPELISIAGSIRSRSASPKPLEDAEDSTPAGEQAKGFLRGIGNMIFGKREEQEESVKRPTHFPWRQYLIEDDVMKRWSTVDMRQV